MAGGRLYLQIVDGEGTTLHLPGGGPLEADLVATITAQILDGAAAPFFDALGTGLRRDLVDEATAAIVAKGVGVLKTQKQVAAAIRAGLIDTLDATYRAHRADRSQSTYITHGELKQTIERGVRAAIQTLKDDTRFIAGSYR